VDIETGEPKWTFPTRTRVESSPLITGDVVIAATQRGMIHAIDLETGEETWNFNAGGNFVASPVVVDGVLLIGNTDGTLYAFGEKEK
jgi:outer membrane protein assembly factor BamB